MASQCLPPETYLGGKLLAYSTPRVTQDCSCRLVFTPSSATRSQPRVSPPGHHHGFDVLAGEQLLRLVRRNPHHQAATCR